MTNRRTTESNRGLRASLQSEPKAIDMEFEEFKEQYDGWWQSYQIAKLKGIEFIDSLAIANDVTEIDFFVNLDGDPEIIVNQTIKYSFKFIGSPNRFVLRLFGDSMNDYMDIGLISLRWL